MLLQQIEGRALRRRHFAVTVVAEAIYYLVSVGLCGKKKLAALGCAGGRAQIPVLLEVLCMRLNHVNVAVSHLDVVSASLHVLSPEPLTGTYGISVWL